MKNTLFHPVLGSLIVLCLSVVSGWAADSKAIEITVAKNDTIIHLCQKYLDAPSDWPHIVRFNRLKNQELIHPGQKLQIPMQYLKGLPAPGRVSFIKGDVTFRNLTATQWMPLTREERLQKGTSIKTGPDGTVEILFSDGTSFVQKPDSLVEISASQEKADGSMWQRFVLRSGRLMLRVRKALGTEQRLEIHTPAAVAAVRGTEFRVRVDDRESMTSEVLDGGVDVRAMNRTVTVTTGYGTKVIKGSPPIQPRDLLLPPVPVQLSDLYRSMPFALSFVPVAGAVFHRVLLTTDAEGKNVVRESVLGSEKAFEATGIEDGEYYLSARSIDDAGIEGLPLEMTKIRVRVHPVPPYIQSPIDGAGVKSKTLSLSWLSVREAVRYEVEISPDREFAGPGIQRMTTAKTAQNFDVPDFGTYYFRVRSVAEDGYEGLWSDAITFRVIPPPPAPPVEQPQLDEKFLRIRWKDQGPKMTYRCHVSQDSAFANLIVEQKVDEPWILIDRPARPGLYYVRISAMDADGYEGGFSQPQTFEIKSGKEKWMVLGTYGMMLLLILLFQ